VANSAIRYQISMTGTLTELRSSLDPMHFQIYALLQFQLYLIVVTTTTTKCPNPIARSPPPLLHPRPQWWT